MNNYGYFHWYVEEKRKQKQLIIQPRMGFSNPRVMRSGLESVAAFPGARIGTITVDSYTRQRRYELVKAVLAADDDLNGYPLVTYDQKANRELLDGIYGPGFPVQVRHGSPEPLEIFQAASKMGIDAIEGGPVSYCLPYGRVPLKDSFKYWRESLQLWASTGSAASPSHVESFAGCMLGQLCPPCLLLALGILEGLFFVECGIRSISLSYAQGTNVQQDIGALAALEELATQFLGSAFSHTVLYSFMGMFPSTPAAARKIIEESAVIAIQGGAARLIVKTTAESERLPTIAENLAAMDWAHVTASSTVRDSSLSDQAAVHVQQITHDARDLITKTLEMSCCLESAIRRSFLNGLLDVPYCLHPDNANQKRVYIDSAGVIRSIDNGAPSTRAISRSTEFLSMLTFNARKYSAL
jgi:methylaspartate mutase epsilon subunit